MCLRCPVDSGEAGVLSYHTPSLLKVSLRAKVRGRRDACRSLYWRSMAQTPHWASIAAPGRGTCPLQVLGGTGGVWLLPAWSPVLRSRTFDLTPTLLTRVQGVGPTAVGRAVIRGGHDVAANPTYIFNARGVGYRFPKPGPVVSDESPPQ